MMVLRILIALMILFAFHFASCKENSNVAADFPDNGDMVIDEAESEDVSFQVVQLIGNLENPWSVAWLPDGRMLITERDGRMNLVEDEEVTVLTGLPDIQSGGQGGLLDVAVHPDYENNGWIYFTYSASVDGGTGTTLARAQLGSEAFTDIEVLYSQDPGYSPGRHYGSRIAFAGDGTVLFTIGDRGQESPSQDLGDPAGSTIRLNDDGSIPPDNPFVNDAGVLPEIYSYGHRNAQGMFIHPESGEIWQHEHGPQGGDALNIIRAGANYGWPVATYGVNYGSGTTIGIEPHEDPDIEDPLVHWSPTSIAPSGMTLYTGNVFPGWEGDIFLGALAQQHLRRVVVEGEEVTHQEELLRNEIGRIRDVRTGPDGYIYLLTDETNGGLYRLEPAE